MKKRYYIAYSGTTAHPQDEGFATISEARKWLVKDAQEELAGAKRKWKSAYLESVSKDLKEIRAGKDRACPLWKRVFIVSF